MTDAPRRVNSFVRPRRLMYPCLMKIASRLFPLCLVVLAGCATPELFYREGVTIDRLDRDLTACRVSALRDVPPAIETRYTPPDTILQPVCHPGGACVWTRIVLRPSQYERIDTNAALREDVTRLCMADKGYARISLPSCSSDVAGRTTLRSDSPQPPLGPGSCAVRTEAGNWRMVTPAP